MTTLGDLVRFATALKPAGPNGAPSTAQWAEVLALAADVPRDAEGRPSILVAWHGGALVVVASSVCGAD